MMNNKKKWIALLTALLCMVPLLAGVLGGGDSAYAADTVNVTLHKKKMDEFPNSSMVNTGELMPEFDRYQGLKDVTFSAWDISTDFYAQLDALLTGSETDAQYSEKAKQVMDGFNLNKNTATQVGNSQVTDDDGNATFPNLPTRTADGTYRVYYFEEHPKAGVDIGTYRLILILPVKANGNELTNIHLYPKNKVDSDLPKKELLDENGDPLQPRPSGAYDYEVGQEIHYRASFMVPNQIGDIVNGEPRYSKLEFNDAVSQTGVKFEGIDKIVIDGTEVTAADFLNTHGTYTPQNVDAPWAGYAGFKLAMNLTGAAGPATANYLSQYAGKTMEIYYTVSFTENTPIDRDINNEFSVTMNHDGGTDDKKVNPPVDPITTGGKKFFKYEDGTPKQALASAEFVVIKKVGGTDYYLKAGAESMTWTAVGPNEDYANATKYISGLDGKFEVKGLEYGTYYLRETQAPNGFAKLTSDVTFVVEKGSYEGAADQEIENVSKGGTLPSTGGMGILAFIVVGIGLMGLAIIRYRRAHLQV